MPTRRRTRIAQWLANAGALLAGRRGHRDVTDADFSAAFEQIAPRTERRVLLSPEDRRRTAYHQGGHALVGMLTCGADPVRGVSIFARGQALGATFSVPDSDRFNYEREELEAKIRVALGGRCAEELVFGQPSTGAESDLQQLTEIARKMVDRRGMSDRIVEASHTSVLALLRAHRWRLDALAAALLKYETLDESTAYAAAGLPAPGSAPGSFRAAAFSALPPAA
jgi:cell division protease FtsH